MPSDHRGRRFRFARHLGGMFLAMYLGMAVGPALVFSVAGIGFDGALRDHPIGFVLVMAFSMTAPMVVWMLFRGHSWRRSGEMAAVMLVPAFLLVCLTAGHVIGGEVCGTYCLASTVAMVALVVYRRDEYRMTAASIAST